MLYLVISKLSLLKIIESRFLKFDYGTFHVAHGKQKKWNINVDFLIFVHDCYFNTSYLQSKDFSN